jgi:uracil-DNA glycosylase
MENYEETPKISPSWKADELFKRKKIDGKLWLPARGDDGAQLLIIAPCPLFSDQEEGNIMSGDYGVELAAALKLAGLHEGDYCVTTLVKYPVGL